MNKSISPTMERENHGNYRINGEINSSAPGFNPKNLLVLGDSFVMYVPGLCEKSVPAVGMMRTKYRRKHGLEHSRMTKEKADEIIQRFLSGENGFGQIEQRRETPHITPKVVDKRVGHRKTFPINDEIDKVQNFDKNNLLVLGPETVMYVEGLTEKSAAAVQVMRSVYRKRLGVTARLMKPEEIETALQRFMRRDGQDMSSQSSLLRKQEGVQDVYKTCVSFGTPTEIKAAAQVCMNHQDAYGFIANCFNLGKTDFEILGLLMDNDVMRERLLLNFGLHPTEDRASRDLNDIRLMVDLREAIGLARKKRV